jgi:hypothetical protein
MTWSGFPSGLTGPRLYTVIPAKAGDPVTTGAAEYWIPAFAGMTRRESLRTIQGDWNALLIAVSGMVLPTIRAEIAQNR